MYKKIAIFPVDYDNATLVRYAFMGEYEPIALLAPELNVLEGCDISRLDGGSFANIKLFINYEEKIQESDLLYLTSSEEFINNKLYKKLFDFSKELGKEVIVSEDISKHFELSTQYVGLGDSNEVLTDIPTPHKMLTIEVPIISIFSIGEKCGQLQTEFMARKYFLSKGYRVLQIGSHDFMNNIGCLNIPDFMFNAKVDPFLKAIGFNRFIHKHCLVEKPDIILLGVPNPIMKYNDSNLNGLGINPFIIQSSIKSDIGIVNMHFGDYNDEFLEEVRLFCKYRLDVDARYFGVSNTSVLKDVDDPDKLEYLYITTEFVKSQLAFDTISDQYTVFSSFSDDDINRVFQKIENELQANPAQL
ncbi:hypothetical protein LXJ15735_38530 [Lacrimispora xylanolytica]